jgi:hypothetical protein
MGWAGVGWTRRARVGLGKPSNEWQQTRVSQSKLRLILAIHSLHLIEAPERPVSCHSALLHVCSEQSPGHVEVICASFHRVLSLIRELSISSPGAYARQT